MSDERTAEIILVALAGIAIAVIVVLTGCSGGLSVSVVSKPKVAELCKCGVACPCGDQEKER